MIQLCFNDDFTKIVESKINKHQEIKKYWTNKNDICNELLEFIEKKSNLLTIYSAEDDSYYCQKCFKKLDNEYCYNCSIDYKNRVGEDYIYIDDIADIIYDTGYFYYYYFDVINDDVILYKIKEKIYFDNPFIKPYKTSEISIDNSYLVKKEGVYDLFDKKFYYYKSSSFENLYYEDLSHSNYIYPYNLEILKNTIYKYSLIWKGLEYLKYNDDINISHLTCIPLCCNEFEYSMKNELYALGFTMKKDEKLPFNKNYLQFIKENNLTFNEYKTLIICKILDISFIKKLKNLLYEDFQNKKINFIKLKEYFDNNNIEYDYLVEYFDYLNVALELGFNIKDKKLIYPKNFHEEYNKLCTQYEAVKNKEYDKKIKKMSKLLEINNYEDDNFIIYPAHSTEELIDESRMQNNCVKTYIENYSNNISQIYLMRKKENKDKSFVTIEVNDGKIVQAKLKNNKDIGDDIKQILNNWEKKLIIVVND